MKKIIILAAVPGSAQGYRYALWAAVPATRVPFYANPNFVSAWKDISGPELQDLRLGNFTERVETFNNETPQNLAAVKAQLEARWTAFQAEIDERNPWDRYGSFFENTSWTNGGVA